ncbi:hypothetical protein [Microbacterium lushaniae]|uniref:Uncharacterized protein n=1 Tax=Microbacterium lushaniae TaxID=2614639 RepID=A0A5J6L386_9MICO|nr:hypothetical protein [Microbacterium lushaniae]QEW03019.1 hypothetical protein F6J85_07835 [Microbacterium lushaniae]
MDNGAWLVAFIPLPSVLLMLGMFAAIILFGLVFALNQIVGLIISATLTYIRRRKRAAVQASSHKKEADIAAGRYKDC